MTVPLGDCMRSWRLPKDSRSYTALSSQSTAAREQTETSVESRMSLTLSQSGLLLWCGLLPLRRHRSDCRHPGHLYACPPLVLLPSQSTLGSPERGQSLTGNRPAAVDMLTGGCGWRVWSVGQWTCGVWWDCNRGSSAGRRAGWRTEERGRWLDMRLPPYAELGMWGASTVWASCGPGGRLQGESCAGSIDECWRRLEPASSSA